MEYASGFAGCKSMNWADLDEFLTRFCQLYCFEGVARILLVSNDLALVSRGGRPNWVSKLFDALLLRYTEAPELLPQHSFPAEMRAEQLHLVIALIDALSNDHTVRVESLKVLIAKDAIDEVFQFSRLEEVLVDHPQLRARYAMSRANFYVASREYHALAHSGGAVYTAKERLEFLLLAQSNFTMSHDPTTPARATFYQTVLHDIQLAQCQIELQLQDTALLDGDKLYGYANQRGKWDQALQILYLSIRAQQTASPADVPDVDICWCNMIDGGAFFVCVSYCDRRSLSLHAPFV